MKRLLGLALLVGCVNDVGVVKTDPDTAEDAVDRDGDGFPATSGDCDDDDPAVYPGHSEACDEVDTDCDGEIDEDVTSTFYSDADADGWGDVDAPVSACEEPEAASARVGDCDDGDAAVNPDAVEVCNGVDDDCQGGIDDGVKSTFYMDADADGFGDSALPFEECSAPEGTVDNDGDCDDTDAAVNPDALEVCNELDDDCDGDVDAADPDIDTGSGAWGWMDADADTYGDPDAPMWACTLPAGVVENDGDCDDVDPDVNPDAAEVCNGVDDECDTLVDEDDPDVDTATGVYGWTDADADGYGDTAAPVWAGTLPADAVTTDTDCDDTDNDISPAASEVCNGVDDECDGLVDEDDPSVDPASGASGWTDADADGYGDTAAPVWACSLPADAVTNDTDCDDTDAAVSPSAAEVCNGVDDECDGMVDDDDPSVDLSTGDEGWTDADADGYGDPGAAVTACTLPTDTVANDDDCDDTDAAVSPADAEVCNGIDDDCDGTVDDSACTCMVDFAAAYAAYGAAANPGSYYGAYGLSFSMGSGYGLIGGDTNGDPGNWSDGGTVPDEAWGLWDFGSSTNTLTFSTAVTNVVFDLARTAGASDITVAVNSYNGGSMVASTTYRLTGGSSVQTVWLGGSVDKIETYITGSGYAYAIDNLEYDGTGTCPP